MEFTLVSDLNYNYNGIYINKNNFIEHLKKVDYIYIITDIDFSKYILPKEKYNYYGNFIVDEKYKSDFKYALGQYGIYLNKLSINILLENEKLIDINNLDKSIGYVLHTNNIFVNNITKNAVIFFHKNIKKLYKYEWIEKCIQSVLNQKNIKFDILELNYGGDGDQLIKNSIFYNISMNVHTDAMVFLLNEGFCNLNYDIIFNTNLDDYYNDSRFYKQKECILDGYIICSTLWHYIKEKDDVEYNDLVFTKEMLALNNLDSNYISIDDIKIQLNKNNNVINHSGICFTKKIWNAYDCNNNLIRYRDDKPFEDLTLWQRVINNNHKITIINEDLIYYRIHDKQIGSQINNEVKDELVDKGFSDKPNQDIKRIGIFVNNKNIKEFINNINKNLLFDYEKIYFILCYIDDKILNELNIKYIKGDLKSFYPKIETLCEVLYDIDYIWIQNNQINEIPINSNIIIKNNYKCGITHYFYKYIIC